MRKRNQHDPPDALVQACREEIREPLSIRDREKPFRSWGE
jgi:hypothetical protein